MCNKGKNCEWHYTYADLMQPDFLSFDWRNFSDPVNFVELPDHISEDDYAQLSPFDLRFLYG